MVMRQLTPREVAMVAAETNAVIDAQLAIAEAMARAGLDVGDVAELGSRSGLRPNKLREMRRSGGAVGLDDLARALTSLGSRPVARVSRDGTIATTLDLSASAASTCATLVRGELARAGVDVRTLAHRLMRDEGSTANALSGRRQMTASDLGGMLGCLGLRLGIEAAAVSPTSVGEVA